MCDTKETIPPLYFYKDAKTCVFWDIDDYPIRNGLDPASIYQSFKEAIGKQLGYHGELTIHAYADKNTATFSEGDFWDAGFKFEVVTEGGKLARVCSMFADIASWQLKNPAPANMIIVADIKEGHQMPYRNNGLLTCKGYNVLLSEAKQEWRFPGGSAASFLTSILDGSGASLRKRKLRKWKLHKRKLRKLRQRTLLLQQRKLADTILLIPRTNFCLLCPLRDGCSMLLFWLPPYARYYL